MEPPSTSSAPMAVRHGPYVPDPRPDPREVMADVEWRVRQLAADAPSWNGPVSLRGRALERALNEALDAPRPPVSGIVPTHH